MVTFKSDDYIDILEDNNASNSSFTKFIPKTHDTSPGANTTFKVGDGQSDPPNYLEFK